MDSVKTTRLNRRSLLLGAVFLVGGGLALTRYVKHGSGDRQGPGLSTDQFSLLEQITDVMIPPTDTPGAIGAGVPAFLRTLIEEWASDETRSQIASVLDAIEKQAWSKWGAAFIELPPERRLDVVRTFDARALAAQEPAYGRFKYLVLLGYYQSEVGATQELRYELVPGAWRSCLPLNEIGRASAV